MKIFAILIAALLLMGGAAFALWLFNAITSID